MEFAHSINRLMIVTKLRLSAKYKPDILQFRQNYS